jgi:hypothetical protein
MNWPLECWSQEMEGCQGNLGSSQHWLIGLIHEVLDSHCLQMHFKKDFWLDLTNVGYLDNASSCWYQHTEALHHQESSKLLHKWHCFIAHQSLLLTELQHTRNVWNPGKCWWLLEFCGPWDLRIRILNDYHSAGDEWAHIFCHISIKTFCVWGPVWIAR